MTDERKTTVKTEYKLGKKIVTTINVSVTDDDRSINRCAERRLTDVLRGKAHEKSVFPVFTRHVELAVLERHNFHRAKHGLAPLQWRPEERNPKFKNNFCVF